VAAGRDWAKEDARARDEMRKWVRKQAKKREQTLASGFYELSSHWSASEKKDCFLNRGLLLNACQSYFHDIVRRKRFHRIVVADSHKRAGFIAKWLMKFRPIQYRSNYVNMKLVLANEWFSLWVAATHLDIDVAEIPRPVTRHILYHFRYRAFDAEAWSLSFFLLQACSRYGILNSIGSSSGKDRDA
jgi:hypothetical protein